MGRYSLVNGHELMGNRHGLIGKWTWTDWKIISIYCKSVNDWLPMIHSWPMNDLDSSNHLKRRKYALYKTHRKMKSDFL